MNMILTGLALTLAVGWPPPTTTQDSADELPKASQAALDRLDDLDVEIDDFVGAFRKEQQEVYRKFTEERDKAVANGDPEPSMPAMRMRADFTEFTDRLMGWADEADGEDVPLYLTRVVQLGGLDADSTGRDAFDMLVSDHVASPNWARLGSMLGSLEPSLGRQRALEVLVMLVGSPSGDVRGWVAVANHRDTIDNAATDSDEYKTARAALTVAIAEAGDKALLDEIEGIIELREKFGIGAVAPDIAGVDLDGVAFKLSDYKGKIVFLDFWGDW